MTEHISVHAETGSYCGWPANYGIWSWGEEIVVGFTKGRHDDGGGFHARDTSIPFRAMQSRSLDSGLTWETVGTPCDAPDSGGLSVQEHAQPEGSPDRPRPASRRVFLEPPDRVDLSHPDFALFCARTGLAGGASSWFYTSTNRCRSWQGPYQLPEFGLPGVAARTDYLIDGQNTVTLFLTAAKANGEEGRPFCARSTDGARSFDFLSWIGPEPDGFAIMPASVRLGDGRILVATRCRAGGSDWLEANNWVDLYGSDDGGASWTYVCRPVAATGQAGNPPALTLLHDGRLCITYGYRNEPYGMRAVLSSDNGETWTEPITLRSDAGGSDIGYPRTVQAPDGTIVTIYYYNDDPTTERYIAATRWHP